jgi:hypothetical protein
MGDFKQQNLLMPLGFYALVIEAIGLIVLWTGYQKKERWAWFVMLIIALGFGVPDNLIPILINMQNGGGIQWSYWLGMKWWGDPLGRGFGLEVLISLVMLVALLLPIKAFLSRSQRETRG